MALLIKKAAVAATAAASKRSASEWREGKQFLDASGADTGAEARQMAASLASCYRTFGEKLCAASPPPDIQLQLVNE
eukprot:3028792-Pyramimonas_sp.AAC.1